MAGNYLLQVVVDFDDFAPDQESNAMNWFIELKHKYPNFRVTLFTILGRWRFDLLKQVTNFDWIELAAHGYYHAKNGEVLEWNQANWFDRINKYEQTGLFTKIFKAPNWEMSPLGYEILKDWGWAVAVRRQQVKEVPTGMKYYCFEDNFFSIHGHTWTMNAHKQEGMFNRWVKETQFKFVSSELETK
jgi:hypothetical protein